MRILIVVHLEPGFDFTGDLEILAKQVVRYSNSFDKVINITSESIQSYLQYFPIIEDNFFDNREWIWGIDIDEYTHVATEENSSNPWIEGKNYIPTTGHQYSEILDWMRELPKDAYYTLVGGARKECLQDIAEIWEYLNYKTRIKEELTYG